MASVEVSNQPASIHHQDHHHQHDDHQLQADHSTDDTHSQSSSTSDSGSNSSSNNSSNNNSITLNHNTSSNTESNHHHDDAHPIFIDVSPSNLELTHDEKHTEILSAEQLAAFHRDGFLFIPAEEMWTAEELKLLISQVDTMDSWPDKAGHWMKYYEKNLKYGPEHPDQPPKILQRIENFLQYNEKLNELINGKRMLNLLGQLFGEAAVLYKEKINYKYPGGDGFKPHQDVSAGWWMYGQTLHISTLISVDASTEANGALKLVRGEHKRGMLSEPWKELPKDLCDQWTWELAPTKPGDIVFFDSFVPHASGPNPTETPRRVIYTTYAKLAEGDLRERYYADKRQSFPPDCERDPNKKYEYKI